MLHTIEPELFTIDFILFYFDRMTSFSSSFFIISFSSSTCIEIKKKKIPLKNIKDMKMALYLTKGKKKTFLFIAPV